MGTLLIVFQSFQTEFALYRLTTPTARAMSGLEQIMANIRLPTADVYGTRDIAFSLL